MVKEVFGRLLRHAKRGFEEVLKTCSNISRWGGEELSLWVQNSGQAAEDERIFRSDAAGLSFWVQTLGGPREMSVSLVKGGSALPTGQKLGAGDERISRRKGRTSP